jgi:aminoglycoside phosphotransferase (APT) family kinase protein
VQLDIEDRNQLDAYLRTNGHATANMSLSIERLAGGVSNRTMLVKFGDGRAWVVKQALAKLRVEVDWFSDPARIEREAQGLRRLVALAPSGTITPLVFEDRAHNLIAMQAVKEPHENWKTLLLAGSIDKQLVEQFGRLLASIHAGAMCQRRLLSVEFADRSFFESLRLEPYYAYSASQVPAAASFLRQVIDDTRRHSDSLVHGDYSPKNVLVHSGRLVLLDHEVIHWGEPAFDLGFSMTHFLSKAHHLLTHRGKFAAAAKRYWKIYREALGDLDWAGDLESRTIRQTLACLLARVAGRSPLEYLSPAERTRQTNVVVDMMASVPETVDLLVDTFLEQIGKHEPH